MTRVLGRAASFTACLIVLAGCAGEPPAAPSAGVATPRPVRVVAALSASVPDTLEVVGTVQPRTRSIVSSRLVATVVAVPVIEGRRVVAGETLVVLDARDVDIQRRRAAAAVTEARRTLDETERSIAATDRAIDAARAQQELAARTRERAQMLVDRGLIAVQDYDEAEVRARAAMAELRRVEESRASLAARAAAAVARIEQAEAELSAAQVASGYATITAPFDGVIAAKTTDVGALAAPGVRLITLEEERYRLEVPVEETETRRLHVGDTAAVVVEAAGLARNAPVVEIVPAADPGSRTFVVKLELPTVPGLRSGLYGRAAFSIGARPALTVPATAVALRGQLEHVFVVGDDAVARLRVVRSGKHVGEAVEILSGLTAGERVAADAAAVSDGARVEPGG